MAWNNVRLVIVEACLLACLILVIVMLNKEDDIESRDTFYLPMWMLGFICLALLVTIISWIIMLVQRYKKNKNKEKYSDDE